MRSELPLPMSVYILANMFSMLQLNNVSLGAYAAYVVY